MSTPPNPRAPGSPPGTDPDRPRQTQSAQPGAAGSSTPPRAPGALASHYELLGLSPGASVAELRQAFRQLSKRYHPDTTTLPAPQAAEAFRKLQIAYGVLSDPAARSRYDAILQGASAVAIPRPGPRSGPGPGNTGEAPRAVGVRRALSGGEWFALLLLGVALVLSLVLGIGVAWARGVALMRSPSWLTEPGAGSGSELAAAVPAATSPLQPSGVQPLGAQSLGGPRPAAMADPASAGARAVAAAAPPTPTAPAVRSADPVGSIPTTPHSRPSAAATPPAPSTPASTSTPATSSDARPAP
jgi:hypothetical protein